MKQYLRADAWSVIEEGFHPEHNRITESIFSLGNGRMGQRANFEEHYSGDSFQGNYVAGIYYPDKTRVGWWKNGYPEYFAKVLNAANWIGLDIFLDHHRLDLNAMQIRDFRRELNMREGWLKRDFTASFPAGPSVRATAQRFCSMTDDECGVMRYDVVFPDFEGEVRIYPSIDFDVVNEDANYDEKFWSEVSKDVYPVRATVCAATKKLDFRVCAGMHVAASLNGIPLDLGTLPSNQSRNFAELVIRCDIRPGDRLTIFKYAAVTASINYAPEELERVCHERLDKIVSKGFDTMLAEQQDAWAHRWSLGDIVIEGDVAAQQGIRFNIFQLNQTYTGKDARLNIGPKGFTGEKYGGSTYWDTEAYCIPFYLSTSDREVARNLLVYRYQHLPKAIENAVKLGFGHGAALYPMVTMNGEECHNEWEITFEEIHRNGAIAYAVHDYIRYTGDQGYLADYGLEVLIGIARFWAQRVNYSSARKKYVMLGVTGPNEYENNVNNNWYTNYIACWCLRYTEASLEIVAQQWPDRLQDIISTTDLHDTERARWQEIVSHMHYPEDAERGVFLQQDGFLDKELTPVAELDPAHLPLNQNWSWDRILRSCYIKQADVLQGLFFFEEAFDEETVKRNFDFYEPLTVHESSLSPCVHAILAAKLGYREKAYEMYLRTARLDLDDYNNDTEDGCHITSMAGTWMAIVKGFGGQRVENGRLVLNPVLPQQWEAYRFKIYFRNALIEVSVQQDSTEIRHIEGPAVSLNVCGAELELSAGNTYQTLTS